MKRAILLIDHGSRHAEANEQLEALAREVRSRLPDRAVFVAHLEIAEPDIDAGIDACVAQGAEEVVVHPYFLGHGRHSTRDIPELVGRAARRHPGVRFAISEPLGLHGSVVDAVVDRIERAPGAS